MNEEDHINRIEDYISGRMSADERVRFEAEINTDAELMRLFREHKFFLDGIAGMRSEAFISKMKNDSLASVHQKDVKKRNLNSYISIAAGIIFLIGISILILRPAGYSHLAKAYYEVPFANIQRSDVGSNDSFYTSGMMAFANQHWQEAITDFNQVPASHPLYDEMIYYMGHAFVGKGEYEKALALFSNPALSQGRYEAQSSWNRILMKMYLDKPKDEIIADLRKISSDPQNFYNTKANELLKKLEK